MPVEGWRQTTLGDLIEVRHGFAFKSQYFDEHLTGGPIVVAVGNFQYTGGFRFGSTKVKEYRAEYPREFELSPGDILLVMTCQTSGGEILGIPARVPDDGRTYLHNQRLGKVVVRDGSPVDEGYLYWMFLWTEFKRHLYTSASGTKILHTAPTRIEAFSFDLPPLSEQRAIAHILGTLDDKIELNRKMNRTLEAMARALFKSWFIDFDPVRAKAEGRQPDGMDAETAALFPDGFQDSELGPIPRGWRASTVGQEFNLKMGQSPPGSTYNEAGDGLPFFQGRRDFGFRFPKRRVYCTDPTRIADPGDTLVTVRAPVGSLNMAKERCCVGRGIAAVRHKSGARSFTYYSMASLGAAFARFEDQGTVFGSLNKGAFNSLHVISPHSVIIDRFEYLVGSMDERIKQLSDESDVLAALRDTLLPKLISGEIRVRDAERLVEGVAGSEAIGHDDARKGEAA